MCLEDCKKPRGTVGARERTARVRGGGQEERGEQDNMWRAEERA